MFDQPTGGVARFNAHFDSECDRCLFPIYAGDEMAYDSDSGEYICEDCADDQA